MANFKDNLLVNRIIALLVGGLLVFTIMTFTVVQSAKKENKAIAIALDESRYDAGRLLGDAKAQADNKDYVASIATLEELFTNQPGSPEAAEGKILLLSINSAKETAQVKWEAALPLIKEEWFKEMATEIRAKSEKERIEMEAGLEKTITQAWDKAKSKVRLDWEKEI